jgi:hypothetical protein
MSQARLNATSGRSSDRTPVTAFHPCKSQLGITRCSCSNVRSESSFIWSERRGKDEADLDATNSQRPFYTEAKPTFGMGTIGLILSTMGPCCRATQRERSVKKPACPAAQFCSSSHPNPECGLIHLNQATRWRGWNFRQLALNTKRKTPVIRNLQSPR